MVCELCLANKELFRLVDENVEAFSIVISEPLKDGHLLVLPKRHVIDFNELTPQEAKGLLNLIDKMKIVLKKTYQQDPIILINTGKHKTQSHLHFHILPSRVSTRYLFSDSQKVPKREDKSREYLEYVRNKIIYNLQ